MENDFLLGKYMKKNAFCNRHKIDFFINRDAQSWHPVTLTLKQPWYQFDLQTDRQTDRKTDSQTESTEIVK